ncbi:MAG: hypothetical protein JO131_02970 [Gammaproteobacteria bacterium]|nr:hypothetical protein [Gammaproteobacteria bacterium]
MKFLYDRFLTIPKVEDNKSKDGKIEKIATHCHVEEVDFSDYQAHYLRHRKNARHNIDDQIQRIQTCMTFFKEYKNASTSPEEKASITAAIKVDQDLIDNLRDARPSMCTIL